MLQLLLVLYLLVLVWIFISKAVDDGLFQSLATVVVLFVAYRFAYLEWKYLVMLLRGTVIESPGASILAAYWIGFLIIMLPGLVLVRLMTLQPVEMPETPDRVGSILCGALCGLLVYAATLQSVILLEPVHELLGYPVNTLRFLFELLGPHRLRMG
ncbi:MAG: hypothetical protein EA425_00025 [Puniceicoccaceae bacterium]|nr:MAG: hypothetical protein EA425_00025 [Puniceicoccaceae bacterium]